MYKYVLVALKEGVLIDRVDKIPQYGFEYFKIDVARDSGYGLCRRVADVLSSRLARQMGRSLYSLHLRCGVVRFRYDLRRV
jgi:hypothetical protein